MAIRATAMAVSIFFIHLFGDAAAPIVIGAVSDRVGLSRAVLIMPVRRRSSRRDHLAHRRRVRDRLSRASAGYCILSAEGLQASSFRALRPPELVMPRRANTDVRDALMLGGARSSERLRTVRRAAYALAEAEDTKREPRPGSNPGRETRG